MTPELINEYISRRMKELGYGDNFHTRLRHFVLAPSEVRTIDAHLQLFLLPTPKEGVRIESDIGYYDLSDTATNELQYEHQGTITMTNLTPLSLHLQMIQVLYKSK